MLPFVRFGSEPFPDVTMAAYSPSIALHQTENKNRNRAVSCPPKTSRYPTNSFRRSKEQFLASLSDYQLEIPQYDKIRIPRVWQMGNLQQDKVQTLPPANTPTIYPLCSMNLPSAEGYRYHLKRRVCAKQVPNTVKNAVKFHCLNRGTGFTNQRGLTYHSIIMCAQFAHTISYQESEHQYQASLAQNVVFYGTVQEPN
jgi:hypothetical protein